MDHVIFGILAYQYFRTNLIEVVFLMIFTLGTTDIRAVTYTCFEDLERELLACEAGSIFAGQKKGSESAWNMIAFTDPETGEYFGIGLLSAGQEEPHVLATDNGLLFIGADNFAIAFSIAEKQVRTLIPLQGDFVDFFYIPEKRTVIIVHKKGVVVKDEEGTELWRASKGAMMGYSLEGGTFVMELATGETIGLKLKNGKQVTVK